MDNNTIKLIIDFDNMPLRYPTVLANKDNYSSELSYKSHMNYYKQKYGGTDTLLEDLAGGAVHSAFYAMKQAFFKSLNTTVPQVVHEAVKEWTKNNPDTDWED